MSALEDAFAIQIRACRLPEPRREFKFHPLRKFRFDFAWPEKMLAVEVQGGHWSGGRHTRGAGFNADCEKGALALIAGYRVLHITSTHIKNGLAIRWLEAALK